MKFGMKYERAIDMTNGFMIFALCIEALASRIKFRTGNFANANIELRH